MVLVSYVLVWFWFVFGVFLLCFGVLVVFWVLVFGVLVLSCVVLSCIVSCCTVLLACGVVYCVAFTNLLFKLRLNFRKQSICSKSPPRGNQVDGLPRAASCFRLIPIFSKVMKNGVENLKFS